MRSGDRLLLIIVALCLSGLLQTNLCRAENSPSMSQPEGNGCIPKRLALKTNVLYDALLMPSVEIGYRFNRRWSAGLEGSVAWWSNSGKHKYYRIMNFLPEVRFHLNPSKVWGGSYLGIFTGGGKYDLENGGRGYQGMHGMLGFSYNYLWNFNCHFSIEAGLGIGVLYTRYKEYLPIDECNVYQKTKRMWYFGPLRANVSLVWHLWNQ